MTKRNYREEIECALEGGRPDYMPFTAYESHIPTAPEARQKLMAMGLSVCCRQAVSRGVTPNVKLKLVDEGHDAVRAILQTPLGEVSKLSRKAAYDSYAPVEFYVKTKDDLKIVEFIVKDRRCEKAYEDFQAAQARIGASGIVISGAGYSPLLELQLVWLGQENFCYMMADDPDAVLSLYEVICKAEQEGHNIVAESPAKYINYCGNIVPEMLGMENIRRYVEPRWKAFADQLHAHHKKMGSHVDANNLLILDMIRATGLDYLEAFTPPPDCNVSVELARRELPDRTLWINFPSSQHLGSDERISAITTEILQQAGDRKGVLFGITEDVPAEHMVRSYEAILRTLQADHDGLGAVRK